MLKYFFIIYIIFYAYVASVSISHAFLTPSDYQLPKLLILKIKITNNKQLPLLTIRL